MRCALALPFFFCYHIYQNKPLVVKVWLGGAFIVVGGALLVKSRLKVSEPVCLQNSLGVLKVTNKKKLDIS